MDALNSPGARIAFFRDEIDKSLREFSALLGFSHTMIGDIEKNKKPPTRRFLEAMSDQFQVSPSWILLGEGPMRLEHRPGFSTGSANIERIEPPDYSRPMHGDFAADGHEYALIRRFDISASAGPGLVPAENAEVDQLAFQSNWLRQQGISANLAALVRVEGNSMAPTIPDGALVLVDASRREITNKKIFAFTYKGDVFVKRLEAITDAKRDRPLAVLISSDNPDVPTLTISGSDLADLRVAGIVRWYSVTV